MGGAQIGAGGRDVPPSPPGPAPANPKTPWPESKALGWEKGSARTRAPDEPRLHHRRLALDGSSVTGYPSLLWTFPKCGHHAVLCTWMRLTLTAHGGTIYS